MLPIAANHVENAMQHDMEHWADVGFFYWPQTM